MLNDEQKEAVQIVDGPVMVIAGAGSGKTRVLTERLMFLIEQGIDPGSILAVTFTNKAAFEMKERIGGKGGEAWVSTFHSMCAKILRKHIDVLDGFNSGFVIIDDDDSKSIVKQVIKELDYDKELYPAKYYASLISKEKNKEPIKLKGKEITEFEKIYKKYNETLKNQNLLDFDDLLRFSVEIFEKNKKILSFYQDKFKYIMIDEFQDTNKIQYRLVELLSSKYKNIFIVGDEDQSIYSFRGADIGNIKAFEKKFPKCKKVILDINYRSTQNILNVANSLIQNNIERHDKNLKSDNDKGNMVVYQNLDTAYEELTYIVTQIDRLLKMGYTFEDMALFYRTNALSRGYEEAFLRTGIPYKIYGGISYFARKEIKDIVSYFRLLLNPNHMWSFTRIINIPKRGIGEATINKFITFCSDNGYDLMEGIDHFNNKKMTDFKLVMNNIKEKTNTVSLPKFVDVILEESGYANMLKAEGEAGDNRFDNIREFKTILADGEENYNGSSLEKLNSVLEDLALKTDNRKRKEKNAISMMNYHQSKGLEFKVVFMVALDQGIFPSTKSLVSKKDLEEERRVAYVGITRAKEQLFITSARSRRLYGNIEHRDNSMFIDELDFSFINSRYKKATDEITKIIDHMENSEVIFKSGDKLNHQYFGDGVVVTSDGEYIEVAFKEEFGIKKLLSKHPSIKKKE